MKVDLKPDREMISFVPDVGLHKRLRRCCFELDETMREFINRAIEEALKKEGY